MSIYFRSFLNKTPLESLRGFLGDISVTAFADVDWQVPRPLLVGILAEAILALDLAARDRVYSVVDRIGQFMNEHGRRVLRGVLPADPITLEQFDALEDVTACALFVLMRKDDAFEQALSAVFAQRLLNGRDWTGLNFEEGAEPKVREDPPVADFEGRLREIFDACGEHHLVEVIFFGPDGGYGWYCPEAGLVAADSDAVAALSIATDRVVTALRELFTAAWGAGRWTPRPLGTDVWLVGAWLIGNAWTTVALARGLDSPMAARRTADGLAALPKNDAGLVITVVEDAGFEAPLGFAVVPLTAALVLNAEGRPSVDAAMLARAVAPHAAARRVAHVGRPSVEARVFAVLHGLQSRGTSGTTMTLNATVVARAWPDFYPREGPPSAATLRRHIHRWRSSGRTRSDP